MSGRGGQTFLTLEQESRARVYDEFRRQISECDTPLFDTSKAGTVTIGDRGGVEGVSRYTFPEEYQGATTEVGVETPDLIEIKPTDEGAQLFRENLVEQAAVTMSSAANGNESRGAHARDDVPDRDDENWMKHTIAWIDENYNVKIDYRPVHMETLTNEIQPFPPKARVY